MAVAPRTPGRATAQHLALDHLRRAIAAGDLAPETWIRQERVAEAIGASVVPVREALKILEAEGQILYVPHRGYQVRRLRAADLVETYRIRGLLEDEAVRLAVDRLDNDLLVALEREATTMEHAAQAGDVAAMTEANRGFHFLVYEHAGMPRMTDFIRQLWQSTDAYRLVYYGDGDHRDRVNDEHRAIIGALRRRDPDLAVDLLRAHRDAAVSALLAVID